MPDINFSIEESIGILSEGKKNTVELNRVSWDGKPSKYDIRRWYGKDEERTMGKGIALTDDETRALYELLKERFEG